MTTPVRRSRLAPDQQFTSVALDTSPENGKSTNIPPATWAPPDFQKPVPPSPASHQPDHAPDQKVIQVVVSDIHMSFRSMVVFLVKAAFAAIPAIIIIAMIWVFIFSFLSGFIRYRG